MHAIIYRCEAVTLEAVTVTDHKLDGKYYERVYIPTCKCKM